MRELAQVRHPGYVKGSPLKIAVASLIGVLMGSLGGLLGIAVHHPAARSRSA